MSIVLEYSKKHTDIDIEGFKKTNRIAGYAWNELSASERDYYKETECHKLCFGVNI